MRILLTAVLLLVGVCGFAQDASITNLQSTAEKNFDDDTTHKSGWKKGGLLNLGLAQGATSNWAAGGEKFSLTVTSFLNLYANLKSGKNRWVNNLDLFYAIQRTSSLGMRKNDDRIDYYSKYTHQMSKKWSYGAVANIRTQFTNGFNYSTTPKQRISDLFAPAYLTLAPGFEWAPTNYFSVFMSPVSARWTFVKDDEDHLGPRYGLDPGKTSRFEVGAFLSAKFKKDIAKNINFRSRLDLYSNYLKNPQNVDIFWTNVLVMKVTKFVSITYNFDLIYDDDARLFGPTSDAPRTQIKSLLSVGFAGRF